MSTQAETGDVTGTKDKDYNIIWFTRRAWRNALRLQTYIGDASATATTSSQSSSAKAQADSRKGAEEGKKYLKARL